MSIKEPEDLIDLFGNMQTSGVNPQKKQVNILLLGETGVGKSTFINSVINYLEYQDFNMAERNKLNVLIPGIFSMIDKDGKLQTIIIGDADDKNETLEVGESATQAVRTYTFLIKGEYQIRFIDTPGMGDTRGIEQDNLNCENILNYISGVRELHAICYLCRPSQTRTTAYFQYCVAQIMTRLHADACKNFVFVFTGCKAEHYNPGETIQILKRMAEEISKKPAQAKLVLDDNKFCFDNEAFRYLAAVKQGVKLKPEVKSDAVKSWTKATEECWKMIEYIAKLKPHHVQNTSAINEARRVIYQLSKPMADIAQLVQDNIMVLQRHNRSMNIESSSIEELKRKLYIPAIQLKVTTLTKPATVCADIKCCELYKVDDRNEYHYKTRCHDPCYLQNVQGEVIGAPELMHCAAMNQKQFCNKCSCSYRVHMHVYYFTEKIKVTKPDTTILKNINTLEDAIQETKSLIRNLQQRKLQYDGELDIITKANAKFAHFLERNAIAAFTDAYEEYIQYLIIREMSLGRECDKARVNALETLLREHNEQKKIFDSAAKEQEKLGREDPITPQIISQTMSELFDLPLNGKDIKALYESQKKAKNDEHASTEYTHTVTFNKMKKKPQIPSNGKGNRGGNHNGNRRGNPNGNRGGNHNGNRGGNHNDNRGGNPNGNRGGNHNGNRGGNHNGNRGGNRGGNHNGNNGDNRRNNNRGDSRDNNDRSNNPTQFPDNRQPVRHTRSTTPADSRPPLNDHRHCADHYPPPTYYQSHPPDRRSHHPTDYSSHSTNCHSHYSNNRPRSPDYRFYTEHYRPRTPDYCTHPADFHSRPSYSRPPCDYYNPHPADYHYRAQDNYYHYQPSNDRRPGYPPSYTEQ